MGGYWDHYRAGYTYYRPRYEFVNGRWAYRADHWAGTPRSYDRWSGRRGYERGYERGYHPAAARGTEHGYQPVAGHSDRNGTVGRSYQPAQGHTSQPAAGRSHDNHFLGSRAFQQGATGRTSAQNRVATPSHPAVHSAPAHTSGGSRHR
jgi:hypothetical protein